MCREASPDRPIVFRQSNREYELIEWIHEAIDQGSAIIINPAAFTFTSMAILDALEDVSGSDHRAAHLQHPQARADLSQVLYVGCRDRDHCRPRPERLSNCRQG